MRPASFICIALALSAFPSVAVRAIEPSSNQARPTPLGAAVDKEAKAFFADTCRVGLSLAVVDSRKDATQFYNYGSTSRSRVQLATSTTLYEIASVTKTFTGALAARAVTDRRMTLDADFRTYLPAPYPNLERNGRPITLRTLASHTSGMPRDIPDTDAAMKDPDATTRPQRLLAIERGFAPTDFPDALRKISLRSVPGQKDEYSNAGMKVIAMGLEQTYGVTFETLMHGAILDPLTMRDTGFVVSADHMERLATAYGRDGKATPYHTVNAGASWGLYSDTADMAHYVRWQLNEKDPVIAQAHAVIARTAAERKGMIWNEGIDHGERVLWHGGGSFGMSSQVVLFPSSGQGFVLLANDACPGTESNLKDMALAIHAQDR
jgi:CubicO group peptidase (beta-lactamase class C family)